MTLTAAAAASSQKNGCTSGFLTPVERAKKLLGSTFREDLEAHLLNGYVISTPETFAMGRPCPKGAEVFGPWRQWPAADVRFYFRMVRSGRAFRAGRACACRIFWLGWVRLGREWPEIHWMRDGGFPETVDGPSPHGVAFLGVGSSPHFTTGAKYASTARTWARPKLPSNQVPRRSWSSFANRSFAAAA
jgi:hypothetical protein